MNSKLVKPRGPFASDGEIASKMEEGGNALQDRMEKLEKVLAAARIHTLDHENCPCGLCKAINNYLYNTNKN